jgi:hypothetical protein
MARILRWAGALAVAATLAPAAPASAQYADFTPPVFDWLGPHLQSQIWCNISWCRNDDLVSTPTTPEERARERARARREARKERRRERRMKARERKRLKRNARKLAFVPVPEVSERVRAELVAGFADGENPEAVQLRAEFDANPPLRQFGELLDANTNWSSRNAADVYAFSLIMLWLRVDDATRTTRATDEAVRADIRASMAASPEAYAASDAEQQEMVERIASWTTVLIGQHNYLEQLGDARPAGAPSADEFRDTLVELGRSNDLFGVDLSAVKLTRKGVVSR